MNNFEHKNEGLRVHSEAPAEGDTEFNPEDERMHAQEPAEGPADQEGA